MKKTISLLLGMAFMASVGATPLASYTHLYGTGQVNPGGTDVLHNGYVTVSDQSSVRFDDNFGFADLQFAGIEHFNLTLTYSSTDNSFFGIPLESWYVRPGAAPSPNVSFKLQSVGTTPISSSFTLDAALSPQFNDMVLAKNFYFWFAEESFGSDSFQLKSAVLDIYGQAPVVAVAAEIPEPASLALFGLGLTGLAASLRRRAKKAA